MKGTIVTSRPNFLILMPDQLRADAVGAFGNPHVDTPHIDALAARGTRFTNAFVQHPVCSPSRASLLTGWYPHTAGHRTLTHLLKEHEPNLLRLLKEAGYHVTWAGARGDTFAPGVTEQSVHEYGFSTLPTTGYGGDYPDGVWSRLFYRGRVPDDGRIDPDEAAVRTAEEWLAHPPEDPWVLFVPLVAPHCPFQVEDPGSPASTGPPCPTPRPPATPPANPATCGPSATATASARSPPDSGARSWPRTTAWSPASTTNSAGSHGRWRPRARPRTPSPSSSPTTVNTSATTA